jgi:hypothetical protein
MPLAWVTEYGLYELNVALNSYSLPASMLPCRRTRSIIGFIKNGTGFDRQHNQLIRSEIIVGIQVYCSCRYRLR